MEPAFVYAVHRKDWDTAHRIMAHHPQLVRAMLLRAPTETLGHLLHFDGDDGIRRAGSMVHLRQPPTVAVAEHLWKCARPALISHAQCAALCDAGAVRPEALEPAGLWLLGDLFSAPAIISVLLPRCPFSLGQMLDCAAGLAARPRLAIWLARACMAKDKALMMQCGRLLDATIRTVADPALLLPPALEPYESTWLGKSMGQELLSKALLRRDGPAHGDAAFAEFFGISRATLDWWGGIMDATA